MEKECQTWKILGHEIGTASGWDDGDFLQFTLYDFEPADGIELPNATLFVDLVEGKFQEYNDEGEVIWECTLKEAGLCAK